jgi:formate hydrogenlyase transcriptional activator
LQDRASNVSGAERARILQVLKETKGMVGGTNGAAARLGLKRTTLQSRMRKYDIGRLYQ